MRSLRTLPTIFNCFKYSTYVVVKPDGVSWSAYQKRLDGSGRFQWPTNASEARQLTRQQFRWLTEGLSIDQPKAIHAGDKRKDF